MLIAIDWGSSHFRALLLNESGEILRRSESDQGILSHHFDGKRSGEYFSGVVQQHCQHWLDEHGSIPCYLGGMIGSRSGWIETDYLDHQQWLSQLSACLVDCGVENFHIIPGVSIQKSDNHWDVMRGEEIQILGALQQLENINNDHSMTMCLPGTHSKWAQITAKPTQTWVDGKIENFSTFMTGELFQWASDRSSLASLMNTEKPSSDLDEKAFIDGVTAGNSEQTLSHTLFSIRANSLMATQSNPRDFLSGLLIGQEIRTGLAFDSNPSTNQQPITIIGNATLASRYQLALTQFDRRVHHIDGEQAFRLGVALIHQLRTDEANAA